MIYHVRSLVDRMDSHDRIGIQFKRDLDLRHALRCGGQALELKLPKEVIVLRQASLSLVHLDHDALLIIRGCREAVQHS